MEGTEGKRLEMLRYGFMEDILLGALKVKLDHFYQQVYLGIHILDFWRISLDLGTPEWKHEQVLQFIRFILMKHHRIIMFSYLVIALDVEIWLEGKTDKVYWVNTFCNKYWVWNLLRKVVLKRNVGSQGPAEHVPSVITLGTHQRFIIHFGLQPARCSKCSKEGHLAVSCIETV